MQFHPEAVNVEVDARRAVSKDIADRYWDENLKAMRLQRAALPVDEQVLHIGNLETFSRGRIQRGREAWQELYASLAALASLDEVAAVAPDFGEHLRAAAECLLPMVRNAPVVRDPATIPYRDPEKDNATRNAMIAKLQGAGVTQGGPTPNQNRLQEIFGTGQCAAAQQLQGRPGRVN